MLRGLEVTTNRDCCFSAGDEDLTLEVWLDLMTKLNFCISSSSGYSLHPRSLHSSVKWCCLGTWDMGIYGGRVGGKLWLQQEQSRTIGVAGKERDKHGKSIITELSNFLPWSERGGSGRRRQVFRQAEQDSSLLSSLQHPQLLGHV